MDSGGSVGKQRTSSHRLSAISHQLLSQPISPTLERLDVVEDDFRSGGDRDGQNEAHAAPQPSPEQQRHGHGEGVELHAVSEEFWVEDVQREKVQGNDSERQRDEVCGFKYAQTD